MPERRDFMNCRPRRANSFGSGCSRRLPLLFLCASLWTFWSYSALSAADIAIVADGQPRAAVFVSERVWDDPTKNPEPAAVWQSLKPEDNRRRLRESVRDLIGVVERMSGAKLPVEIGAPKAGDSRIAILVGELAAAKFGPPAKTAEYQQGLRIVVGNNAVGLIGESDLATSYAIYTLLDQLGCRWFLPSAMGEVLPTSKSIPLKEQDISTAPITFSRAHPLNDPGEPNNKSMQHLVEGWGKSVLATSYYFYGYYLAEVSSPNPMLTKWGHDIPFIYHRGACRYWQPETMANFETSLHAHWLGMRMAWDPSQKPEAIIDAFYGATHNDAARVATQFNIVAAPLKLWRFQTDKDKTGEASGWSKSDFNDSAWKTTDSVVDTWSSLGLHNYMGSAWYRMKVKLPPLAADKKTFLWLGATDGRVKVFVDGQHVPHVNDKGEQADSVSGHCEPFSFNISPAVKADAENSISLFCTREVVNELGTGGLLAPAAVYVER